MWWRCPRTERVSGRVFRGILCGRGRFGTAEAEACNGELIAVSTFPSLMHWDCFPTCFPASCALDVGVDAFCCLLDRDCVQLPRFCRCVIQSMPYMTARGFQAQRTYNASMGRQALLPTTGITSSPSATPTARAVRTAPPVRSCSPACAEPVDLSNVCPLGLVYRW